MSDIFYEGFFIKIVLKKTFPLFCKLNKITFSVNIRIKKIVLLKNNKNE